MPSREEVTYFGAGPAPLPTPVLEDAAKALLNYNDMGIGIAEMSHRSPQANAVLAEAKEALSALLEVPDDYEILFLQGGGSGEFSATAYHMVGIWVEKKREQLEQQWKGTSLENASEEMKVAELKKVVKRELKMDYLVTGSWSLKASQEAGRLMGSEYVNIAIDAREYSEGKFRTIPSESTWKLSKSDQVALTYYCDNETVDGVEFPSFPQRLESNDNDGDRLIVADMSSNFLSRKIDVKKYSIIFGGAQKNIGSTGITIVIMRKSLLPPLAKVASPTIMRQLGLSVGPVVLDYPTIAKNNSLYNTLPIFDVWIAGQVMKRLLKLHGDKNITGQEAVANEKSKDLYGTIEKYPLVYQVVPDKTTRSRMNICMRIKGGDADAEKKFLSGSESRGLTGLKGHRSVGGIRISNYNAVSVDGVRKLIDYLDEFAKNEALTNGSA